MSHDSIDSLLRQRHYEEPASDLAQKIAAKARPHTKGTRRVKFAYAALYAVAAMMLVAVFVNVNQQLPLAQEQVASISDEELFAQVFYYEDEESLL